MRTLLNETLWYARELREQARYVMPELATITFVVFVLVVCFSLGD